MATMLIADNDVGFADKLNQFSQRHGHQVRSVGTGHALLDQLEQTPTDLCVIEILLPDLDGLEVIPKIRRRYPHIKILAICGGGIFGPDTAQLFLKMARFLGADGVLAKPFVLHEFLDLIHTLLGVPFRAPSDSGHPAQACGLKSKPDEG